MSVKKKKKLCVNMQIHDLQIEVTHNATIFRD